jgi:FkbM family methyltransferase
LKHRLIAWISTQVFDDVTYTVRHGLLKGMKRQGGLGWVPALFARGIENPELHFWNSIDLRGMTVYDIGAFHGLLTVFFASRADTVVSFEPNARNRMRLLKNLQINGIQNVEVRPVGVGSRSEILKMVGSPLMPGGSSVDEKTVEGLLKAGLETVVEEIPVVALDDEIARNDLPSPDFIKVDIEGWELEALRGCRQTLERDHPALFLEMHGETLREKKAKVSSIVTFLWDLGYHEIRHIETGVLITRENSEVAIEGHLYCKTPAGGS